MKPKCKKKICNVKKKERKLNRACWGINLCMPSDEVQERWLPSINGNRGVSIQ